MVTFHKRIFVGSSFVSGSAFLKDEKLLVRQNPRVRRYSDGGGGADGSHPLFCVDELLAHTKQLPRISVIFLPRLERWKGSCLEVTITHHVFNRIKDASRGDDGVFVEVVVDITDVLLVGDLEGELGLDVLAPRVLVGTELFVVERHLESLG